jgi:predicted membrane chloride channel (bestrophin family)
MKDNLNRLFSILSFNTLIALLFSIGSMFISIHYGWKLDFPLTIIGIAVVFPIVFSIGGAYNRREAALVQYGLMKSMGRCIFLASKDWLRDEDETRTKNLDDIKIQIFNIFTHCISLFQSKNNELFADEEKLIYCEFTDLSTSIEILRDRGLSGSEVSRVHSYLNKFLTAFETIKHIHQYRTPRTLRFYSKFFIYVILIALGPYFAMLAENQEILISLLTPILFSMVFTGLDNIQEHLENPFDQIGEDDIKMNPEKFMATLEKSSIKTFSAE